MELTGAFKAYDVFTLEGQLKIDSIPRVSPKLQSHILSNPEKDLILDLSNTGFVDSSAIRLLVNLKKKKEETNRKLYILSPSERVREMFQSVNLTNVMDIVDSCEQVYSRALGAQVRKYEPYTRSEREFRRMDLFCPSCSSSHVVGYSIDPYACEWQWSEWKWEGDELFPHATLKESGIEFDFFALQPIICPECWICSIEPDWFSARKDSEIAIHSILEPSQISRLQKTRKARNGIMQTGAVITDAYFSHPRDNEVCYLIYCLAADCVERVETYNNFHRGFYHYCASKYAHTSKVKDTLSKARTWLKSAMDDEMAYNNSEYAKVLFMMMNIGYYLDKKNESYAAFDRLTDLTNKIQPGMMPSYDDPHFWYTQAKRIYARKESE
ncbi:MAG: STAS domain-containing protein [Chitinivibrionales bacterium]|nr:STAS domain-containing protein [Chitinivibrionales bacterium]